ncbi:hypothetical protein ULMS_27120 [Patiriisocius marinistellae]|uniref:O-antigen ligase-related domain-containing protein n=1 Tax=Patiriisocius marinistellae TaxID=2494560 RepID=A0A5J4G0X1_9FLAO|nr:O-antigen ligase family protein [Patiriisocius marinistellae]GEQ87204.1 hypothetical protein ULMS_27120 [Patiriisocius marinistellae]
MKKFFFIIFIFLSFITQTITEPGTNPILSRLTPSDIFGALGLLFGVTALTKGFTSSSSLSKVYQSSLFLIVCFFLPIMFSYNITGTLIESLILLFLILISVTIFQNFKNNLLDSLFPILMYTMICASILGFYDLISSTIGLPRIFPKRTDGEALSGFRNAGQAGAYYLVMLSILIPLRYSSLYDLVSPRNRKILRVSIIISIIFIFLTGKIAAYIGLAAGILFFLLYKRNFKATFGVIFGVALLSILWVNLETLLPNLHNRVSKKYDSRVTQRIEGTNKGGFMEKNFGAAIQSFEDRPLIGSGIGGFSSKYGTHEVHSTYFKMLGETGLFGVIGYLIFLISFIYMFKYRKFRKVNPYSDYLATMFPFILGCLISWGYTYHLRKREFWILVAVIMIVNYCAINYKQVILEEEV